MERWTHTSEELSVMESSDEIDPKEDDFDRRWNAQFGEPSTHVFVGDEFDKYMEAVIAFE